MIVYLIISSELKQKKELRVTSPLSRSFESIGGFNLSIIFKLEPKLNLNPIANSQNPNIHKSIYPNVNSPAYKIIPILHPLGETYMWCFKDSSSNILSVYLQPKIFDNSKHAPATRPKFKKNTA